MLSRGQLEALNLLRTGKNVFLSGEAGTGKSFVLNYFLSELEEDKNVIVCAPTGIAALNIHGATLHRTFKVPIEPISPQRNPLRTNKAIREADIIVIDEISMCRFDCFEYVAKCIRLAEKEAQNKENVQARKEWREPIRFKNKQLIVVGDFFQLPPVITEKDRPVLERYWGEQMSVGDGFAFQAPMWKEFKFLTIILDEPIRQREDVLFVNNLNKIRCGEASALNWLERNAAQEKQMGINLCPTNKAAETINTLESEKLKGKAKKYYAKMKGIVNATDKPTTDELELKEGMQVMALINDCEDRYKNGTIGTVKKLKRGSIEVIFNGIEVEMVPYVWEIYDYDIHEDENGKSKVEKIEIGTYTQLPIRIAYAITIHKSQGQTYDCANINPACFASGQLYVAFSRVKKIKNVYLTSRLQSRYLICSEAVLNFYNHGIRVYDPIKKDNVGMDIEDFSPVKTIDCVIDNIDMFQFVRDFVKKEKDGLYYCDGHYVKNKKDESLPVKFNVSNAYEVFSMFGSLWGGWNDCPEWRTMERKSKEWYEKYGAEIIKISHDSLEFKCYKKLVAEEIEQLMIEIADFAPNSLDLADYEAITDKLRSEGRFVLWWD